MSTDTPALWHSRGYLPHVDAPGLVQHIVFRLADSLPAHLRRQIARCKRDQRLAAFDAELDRGYGRRDLQEPVIASLVETALLRFDGERYALIAWCVMPNHVHALVETQPGHRLDKIIHSWKSYTAKQANTISGRAGSFWASEYFDRFMCDEAHLTTTARYIEGNPVTAGLCENVVNWRFSSAWRGRDARAPN